MVGFCLPIPARIMLRLDQGLGSRSNDPNNPSGSPHGINTLLLGIAMENQ